MNARLIRKIEAWKPSITVVESSYLIYRGWADVAVGFCVESTPSRYNLHALAWPLYDMPGFLHLSYSIGHDALKKPATSQDIETFIKAGVDRDEKALQQLSNPERLAALMESIGYLDQQPHLMSAYAMTLVLLGRTSEAKNHLDSILAGQRSNYAWPLYARAQETLADLEVSLATAQARLRERTQLGAAECGLVTETTKQGGMTS